MVHVWLEAALVAGFILLVAGILIWLRAADRKLALLLEAAQSMERSVGTTAAQVCEFVQPATESARIVQRQLDQTARIFDAARRVGDAAADASDTLCRMTELLNETASRHVEQAGGKYRHRIADAMDWAEVGLAAWQFWQSKRRDSHSSACSRHDEGHDTNY
ncbi:hypothetical protein K0T92_15525 [Paenibacillus oenotherae]|uniref:DUF948 domain-containing protein n=1 Tax=Paenibacillus oenotherae TaxID=1435645 RepID=A0ABS7DAH4_9BACL|nr:DUF948 domain-containing protein [Paenibacillus oenotherae]MBW7476153.1 hypothetical protein [Paenibacillus oenotherae]